MIRNVSDTAVWVAQYRAEETSRADALFQDPLAAALAGPEGRQIAASMPGSRYSSWAVVLRTCVIDAYLRERVACGDLDAVLNLGAGLDTRPYRLDLPSTLQWLEVDFPEMIQFKEERLGKETPSCRLERIQLDLTDGAARARLFAELAGRFPRILVLTEGVVAYLDLEQAAGLARDLRAHESFRYWIVDYFSPEVAHYMKKRRFDRKMKNAPFLFDPPDWHRFFADQGWRARQMRYLGEESEKLGRPIPLPLWARVLRALTPAARHGRFTRFLGYALLAPQGGATQLLS